ncbi:1841_t:CDS:2 [Scutellospora calospora]|uniref:1841_t:CDS:1 n=1 Tax=Scutellospora calospora TaxID=85575 RepID=A0ACA9JWJ7_9GLOM|nr:1841_t:CDS:2 [Scutellospora calospora]
MSFEEPFEKVLNLSTRYTQVDPVSADTIFKNSLDRLTLDTLRALGAQKKRQSNEDRLRGDNSRFDREGFWTSLSLVKQRK